jgi:hypothetical protein
MKAFGSDNIGKKELEKLGGLNYWHKGPSIKDGFSEGRGGG